MIKYLKKLKSNNKGMSLIEVVTVAGVIVIMSGMVFLTRETVEESQKIKLTARKISSDIRKMQSYTLNYQGVNNKYKGGWGLRFNKGEGRYFFYFDEDEDKEYGTTPDEKYQEDINLSDDMIIDNIYVYNGGTVNNAAGEPGLNITFVPPFPDIYICPSNIDCDGAGNAKDEAEIVLKDPSSNNTKIVKINRVGLVEVLD